MPCVILAGAPARSRRVFARSTFKSRARSIPPSLDARRRSPPPSRASSSDGATRRFDRARRRRVAATSCAARSNRSFARTFARSGRRARIHGRHRRSPDARRRRSRAEFRRRRCARRDARDATTPRDAARPSIGDTDGDAARRRRERTTRTDDARTVDAFSRIDDRRATRDGRLTEAVGTTRARSEQL